MQVSRQADAEGAAAGLALSGGRPAARPAEPGTAWGVAYLIEVAARYVFAFALALWTLVYGEHEKKKAEQLAAAAGDPGSSAAADAER
jgi:hypothetical protein